MSIVALDHVLFWPIQLKGSRFEKKNLRNWVEFFSESEHWKPVDGLDREQGLTKEEQLAEFVYFHPFVRSILYSKRDGPLRVLKRLGINAIAVKLDKDDPAETILEVRGIHLYLFNTQNAVLVIEIASNDEWEVRSLQNFLDAFRRIYRPYYDDKGGHVLASARWLTKSVDGEQKGPCSDYPDKKSATTRVEEQREPPVSGHWSYLLKPLDPWHEGSDKHKPAWRHLADERLPGMTFLGVNDPTELEPGDWVRLTFMDDGGDPGTLPYATGFLSDFERRYCYDRYWDPKTSVHGWMRTRFTCCGYHTLVAGDHRDAFFMNEHTGLLFHFRQQYFNLGLLVHMQYGSLLVFLDRLYHALDKYERSDTKLHQRVQLIQRDFVKFTAGLWFTEVTSHMQGKELYEKWMAEMGTPRLSEEVRSELQIAHESLAGMESLRFTKAAIAVAPAAVAVAFWGMSILKPPPEYWSCLDSRWGTGTQYVVQFGLLLATYLALWGLLRLWMRRVGK